MVLPTGLQGDQRLTVVEKDANGRVDLRSLMPVALRQVRDRAVSGNPAATGTPDLAGLDTFHHKM